MDSSVPDPTAQAIGGLGEGDEIPSNTSLSELSCLTADGMKLFREKWDDTDSERRLQIISRLVEMAEDNLELNFDSIFKHCLGDSEEDIRCLAIEGLWENEETSLIDPLILLLEEDESEKVQSAAAVALGKFAVMAEFGKLRPVIVDKVREALLGAIDDRNRSAEVIRRVLEAAAPLSMPDVREAINRAYESDDSGLKISAIFAMGKSFDSSWLPVLLKETDNYDAEIRYEAAGACGELEDEEAVPSLARLATRDDDVEVRLAAIQALGKIGGISAGECLKLCGNDPNDAVREAAEEALRLMSASEDPLSFRL